MILNADLLQCRFSLNFTKNELNGLINNNKFVSTSFIGLLDILKNNADKIIDGALSKYKNYFLSHMASRIRVDENNEMYVEYVITDIE